MLTAFANVPKIFTSWTISTEPLFWSYFVSILIQFVFFSVNQILFAYTATISVLINSHQWMRTHLISSHNLAMFRTLPILGHLLLWFISLFTGDQVTELISVKLCFFNFNNLVVFLTQVTFCAFEIKVHVDFAIRASPHHSVLILTFLFTLNH